MTQNFGNDSSFRVRKSDATTNCCCCVASPLCADFSQYNLKSKDSLSQPPSARSPTRSDSVYADFGAV